MADLKCSDRRVILQKVQSLVNELIQINETAYRQTKALEATDIASDNIDTAVELTLSAAGLLTVIDGGTPWKISDNIGGILAGAVDVDVSAVATTLSWTHDQES